MSRRTIQSNRWQGKSKYYRLFADAAVACGERVGEIYRDVDGKFKIRPYQPSKKVKS